LDSINFFWSFFKMLASLAIVIAMMIGAMYLMKKYFYQSPVATGGSAMIHIVSACHLGPKNSILLVEVLGQVILLGVSNNQMSILTTINDPGAMENLKNIRLKEGLLPVSDPFTRCKSLFHNFSLIKKDR
jgi:flagellar protein FliO/FliZ